MMTRWLPILALLVCVHGPAALASETMPMLPADDRIKLLPYDDDDVYTIVTRYGYQTNVIFGHGEEIQTISVGDRSLWQIIPSGNRMFIRPMLEGVITNMTVITSKHTYQFDLKSLAEGKTTGNIYVAKFMYKTEEKPHPAPAAMPSSPPSMPYVAPADNRPMHPNFNYTYAGPDALAPKQAYDDGKSTFVRYVNPPATLPRTYVVLPGGREVPVASHMHDDTLVVNTIAAEIAIESQAGAIHLYNEMLNPK